MHTIKTNQVIGLPFLSGAVYGGDFVNFGDYPAPGERHCFSDSLGDYEKWREILVQSNKTEADRQAARERFSPFLSAARYEHFKQSLSCNWFTYPVGSAVRGYIIQPHKQGAHCAVEYS